MNYRPGRATRDAAWHSFEVSYVGNEGRHLIRQPDINQPSFAVLQANAALPAPQQLTTNQLRPYLGYNRILMFRAIRHPITTRCKSTQRSARATSWPRSAIHFRKALTDASVLGAHSDNPAVRRFSYGVADFDRRNVVAVTYIYDSPFLPKSEAVCWHGSGGWQLSGITRAQSGNRYEVWLSVRPILAHVRCSGLGGQPA